MSAGGVRGGGGGDFVPAEERGSSAKATGGEKQGAKKEKAAGSTADKVAQEQMTRAAESASGFTEEHLARIRTALGINRSAQEQAPQAAAESVSEFSEKEIAAVQKKLGTVTLDDAKKILQAIAKARVDKEIGKIEKKLNRAAFDADLFSSAAGHKKEYLTEEELQLVERVEKRKKGDSPIEPSTLLRYMDGMKKVPIEIRLEGAVTAFNNWKTRYPEKDKDPDLRAEVFYWLHADTGIRFFNDKDSLRECMLLIEKLKQAGHQEEPFEKRLKNAIEDFDSNYKATKNPDRDYKGEILKWMRDENNIKFIHSYNEFLAFANKIEALKYTVSKAPTENEYTQAASSALGAVFSNAMDEVMSSDYDSD